MADVFAAPGATLLHLEVHPLLVDSNSLSVLLDFLDENGFGVASVVTPESAAGIIDDRRWYGLPTPTSDMGSVRRTVSQSDYTLELLLRK